jgi:acyl-CoA synthetase (AMP-forming)/AMP-acid ligase II
LGIPEPKMAPFSMLLIAEQLIEWTNARLGKQQRIRSIVCRATLPRNANGKVLKRELRQELQDLVF